MHVALCTEEVNSPSIASTAAHLCALPIYTDCFRRRGNGLPVNQGPGAMANTIGA